MKAIYVCDDPMLYSSPPCYSLAEIVLEIEILMLARSIPTLNLCWHN
jgi:hypothetical protein